MTAGDGGHREGQPPTERQLEVFREVAELGSAKAAAHTLGVSLHTVKNELNHLYRRLGAAGGLNAAWLLWGRKVEQ